MSVLTKTLKIMNTITIKFTETELKLVANALDYANVRRIKSLANDNLDNEEWQNIMILGQLVDRINDHFKKPNAEFQDAEFQESLAMFNDFLINWDIEPLDETEAKDWGLVGGETEDGIRSLAFDFRSEMKSERASERDDYRANYEEICDRLTDED